MYICAQGVRTVWVYHLTFLVNSACHVWGYQSWNTGDLSKNNWLVSKNKTLITFFVFFLKRKEKKLVVTICVEATSLFYMVEIRIAFITLSRHYYVIQIFARYFCLFIQFCMHDVFLNVGGQQYLLLEKGGITIIMHSSSQLDTGWSGGRLIFRGTSYDFLKLLDWRPMSNCQAKHTSLKDLSTIMIIH